MFPVHLRKAENSSNRLCLYLYTIFHPTTTLYCWMWTWLKKRPHSETAIRTSAVYTDRSLTCQTCLKFPLERHFSICFNKPHHFSGKIKAQIRRQTETPVAKDGLKLLGLTCRETTWKCGVLAVSILRTQVYFVKNIIISHWILKSFI